MTTTLKKLYQGQLTTSPVAVYTTPALTQAIIKAIVAINLSGSIVDLTLWDGGSADANRIHGPEPIDANGGKLTFGDGDVITLAAGGTLVAKASAGTSITLTVYGTEHT